ncbi:hypothetical protein F2Q69_00050009 [Brassica cretica]|uniref:Uncharacterized protein n=1 Tax=Brassica cretica TaxID=69181 RepID=A0A8S9PYI0_BRACR|nr:hypothetical protein F2Q69_00050009 [Brassica cretica]
MAMMVTIPPSCLCPPPDPPTPSFLGLMQHCSSSLKMMVTALPPLSQPRPPSDPARNKHLPIETPPVKPPEPPDPPDVSVSFVLFTSSSSSPQATQRSSPVVYRLYLCQLGNGSFPGSYSNFDFINPLIDVQVHLSSLLSVYSYSFEKDAMLDVWVTLDLWFLALFGSVLMDSVSFGYIFVPLSGLYVALMQLSTAVCSLIIVFNLVCGAAYVCFSSWWQLKETIIVICCLVNMVMAGIDCPLGSCLEKSLCPIFPNVWSELDEHVWLVLQGFSSRLTLFPAFSAVVVTLRVTRDAIVQETHETVVMRFLMFTCCDLYFHSILGLSVSYSIELFVALLYSPFMELINLIQVYLFRIPLSSL